MNINEVVVCLGCLLSVASHPGLRCLLLEQCTEFLWTLGRCLHLNPSVLWRIDGGMQKW